MEETAINKDNKVVRVDKILENTIDSIDNSKDEILEIIEHARSECIRLERELKEIKEKTDMVIKEVDSLYIEEKRSRAYLSMVSKNFTTYDEEDIKYAYDRANELRIQLLLKREEEKILRERRTEKEFNLKSAIEVFERTEKVGKSIKVASEYLKGNLDDIILTIDDLNKRQLFGIKVIEAQEEERQRLARDIHDGPAQSMANILVKTELCDRLIDIDPEKSRYELQNLKTITRTTLKDIRKTIYDLRPMSLDDLGLIPTLERYIYNFINDTKINVELNIIGNIIKLNSAIEIAIFRIVQESLSNIMKHSQATDVKVTIEYTTTRLNLVILDNGIGFDVGKVSKSSSTRDGGFGLINIRERVELLDGKLQIKSAPGEGTRLSIYILLHEEES